MTSYIMCFPFFHVLFQIHHRVHSLFNITLTQVAGVLRASPNIKAPGPELSTYVALSGWDLADISPSHHGQGTPKGIANMHLEAQGT